MAEETENLKEGNHSTRSTQSEANRSGCSERSEGELSCHSDSFVEPASRAQQGECNAQSPASRVSAVIPRVQPPATHEPGTFPFLNVQNCVRFLNHIFFHRKGLVLQLYQDRTM